MELGEEGQRQDVPSRIGGAPILIANTEFSASPESWAAGGGPRGTAPVPRLASR